MTSSYDGVEVGFNEQSCSQVRILLINIFKISDTVIK